MILDKKIDFAVIFSVNYANPNGDPASGGIPRTNLDGFGMVTDVCIKRKIRNRMQDMGEEILVKTDEFSDDGYTSISDRIKGNQDVSKYMKSDKDKGKYAESACKAWTDVRTFGAVLAFKGAEVGIGIRGPVSVMNAYSLEEVDIFEKAITKSTNAQGRDDGKLEKNHDTMGVKYFVEHGVYVIYGGIFPQLAEKTGFTWEDSKILHEALLTLFENDASAARPMGSMEVNKVFWWEHNCKAGQYSSAKVHHSLHIEPDEGQGFTYRLDDLDGLEPDVQDGF